MSHDPRGPPWRNRELRSVHTRLRGVAAPGEGSAGDPMPMRGFDVSGREGPIRPGALRRSICLRDLVEAACCCNFSHGPNLNGRRFADAADRRAPVGRLGACAGLVVSCDTVHPEDEPLAASALNTFLFVEVRNFPNLAAPASQTLHGGTRRAQPARRSGSASTECRARTRLQGEGLLHGVARYPGLTASSWPVALGPSRPDRGASGRPGGRLVPFRPGSNWAPSAQGWKLRSIGECGDARPVQRSIRFGSVSWPAIRGIEPSAPLRHGPGQPPGMIEYSPNAAEKMCRYPIALSKPATAAAQYPQFFGPENAGMMKHWYPQ